MRGHRTRSPLLRSPLLWPRSLRALLLGTLVLLAGAFAACSSQQKKLSSDGGSVLDDLIYGTLGKDRDTTYYFQLVRDSHHKETFAYLPSADTYIVDKNVDAVQKLGQAEYARLEGQAQVVALLVDVLLEDRSALAQANAANSLTRLGLKLPQYRSRGLEERGDRFLALLQEMDRLWQKKSCAPAGDSAYARQRTVQILNQIGQFEMATITIAKDTLKPFYTRAYLIDAKDPAIRTASDTALSRRMSEAIRLALRAGIEADEAFVREESVRGSKTIGDRGAIDAVLGRLEVETHWRVRSEILEYLGRIGGEDAVAALLPLLDDGDPTVRHGARKALTRMTGRDLGIRRATWTRWAHGRYPALAARAAEAAAEAAEAEADAEAGPSGASGPRRPSMP